MGIQTIVHGRILLTGNVEKSRQYLQSRADDSEFPWLRTELFSSGATERPYYYQQSVIGFAADYKAVEYEWRDFILKFEQVLRNIEFDTAKIEMETEFYGNYNFFWKSKTGAESFKEEDALIETKEWFFGFGHRNVYGHLTEPLREAHIFDIDFSYPVKQTNEYDLYWEAIKIGTITQTNEDMRSSGTLFYTFDYKTANPVDVPLANFIRHSIQTSNYLETGDDINYEKMCEEEAIRYMEFVDKPGWQLLDYKGATIKILCPVFHDNDEISWQKN